MSAICERVFERVVVRAFGGVNRLEQERFEAPPRSTGKVQVRIAFAGVNRADVLLREGKYHLRTLPITPGLEASGTVLETSEGFQAGERVLIYKAQHGMYAGLAEVTPDSLIRIPDAISLKVAASIPLNWITAYDCLDRLMALKRGQTVAIFAAASGVGQAAIQIALERGARPYGIVTSEAKAEYLRRRFDIPVLATGSPEEIEPWFLSKNGAPSDGVFDLVGGSQFRYALKLTRAGGVVVQAANPSLEDSWINVRDFYPRNISIHGFQYGNLIALGRDCFAEQLQKIFDGITRGHFLPAELFVFPAQEAASAHLKLEDRSHVGKILLQLGEES
jgi:NADPH2:quinone reductase